MTELELYEFVQGKVICWDADKLLLWIPFSDLEEFTKMVGYDYISDGGEEVSLQFDCIAIELNDICFNLGIEPTNILNKKS